MCVGTSEWVRARLSVDMGMCVKKAGKQACLCGCAHLCKCRMGCWWEKVLVLPSLWCKPWLETRRWSREGPESSVRTPLSFLLPDLYQVIWEGNNVIGTQASSVKGPEGN